MAENLEVLFSGFSRLNREQRLERLKQMSRLSDEDLATLEGKNTFDLDLAENFIENVVGYFPMPLGIATNIRVDGRDIPIPMAIEESSVIAACSASGKWIRKHGGWIQTKTTGRHIIGQVQFPSVKNPETCAQKIEQQKQSLLAKANQAVPGLVRRGGGVENLSVRTIDRPDGQKMLVLHVYCDPCDAMGANLINQVCEFIKPDLEAITQETAGLCILSNLVDTKLTEAEIHIPDVDPNLAHAIQEASLFAQVDPYRACTHNKGVLNGIDPVLIATGNDWRAVEAGVHAYSVRKGNYRPITNWYYEEGELIGKIKAPIVVGSVGGVTRLHPTAQVCMRILGVKHANELSRIIAAVGLVQNLGALRALASDGIVKGHMSLHAANLAVAAGANSTEMPAMKEKLFALIESEKMISLSKAKDVLATIRSGLATHEKHS